MPEMHLRLHLDLHTVPVDQLQTNKKTTAKH